MSCGLALRFFYSAFSASMGCLFGCFRVRTDRCPPKARLPSEPVEKSRRSDASPNQFTSLLASEGDDDSPYNDEHTQSLGFQQAEITDRGLVDEAKFLKACGILAETPTEIRKVREKLEFSEEQDLDSGSPRYHSWYPDTSVEKLCLKNEGQAKSLKPLELCEEWQDGVACSEHPRDSFVAETDKKTVDENFQIASIVTTNKIQDNELDNTPVCKSPQLPSAAIKSRAKSVHFAREPETPLRSSNRCLSEKGGHGLFKYSPHPTPLKITDEMETPGTIYATNLDSATKCRNARIRSQYVYSASNPVEDISKWRVLKEDEEEGEMEEANNDSFQQPDSIKESSEHFCVTPSHYSDKENEVSADKNLNAEASLSVWLRPASTTTDGSIESREVTHTQNMGLTPGSRPILGVLPASYWNSDSEMSPKCWDGNGIPNTTNKYKEDQKVKWHATPFEERIEKALSESVGSIPERYDILYKVFYSVVGLSNNIHAKWK
uniref:Protein JASON-like n=1 Tax=Kalanchoe fedtschenkoi TaxID=63787 RepID=A0A7N0ZXD0_KALFE